MNETAAGVHTTADDVFLTTDYDYNFASTPCDQSDEKDFAGQLLPLVYSLVFVFGSLGNILVIVVLTKYKRLKSMTDIYLLNLSISDLLFVVSLPFWAYYAKNQWDFGDSLCKLLSGIYFIGFYSSLLFIILLTVDRYLAIVHAILSFKARTVTYGIITSAITWGVALLVSLPGFIFHKAESENKRLTCSPHYPMRQMKAWKLFITFKINILGLIIPMAIMIFCYTKIILTLSKCKNEKKHKAVKLIFIIMVTFFLFWAPYNIVLVLYTFQDSELFNTCMTSKALVRAMQWTESIAFIHCCLNPIIYAFVGEKFRMYLGKVLPKWIPCTYCKQTNKEKLERQSSAGTQSSDLGASTIL